MTGCRAITRRRAVRRARGTVSRRNGGGNGPWPLTWFRVRLSQHVHPTTSDPRTRYGAAPAGGWDPSNTMAASRQQLKRGIGPSRTPDVRDARCLRRRTCGPDQLQPRDSAAVTPAPLVLVGRSPARLARPLGTPRTRAGSTLRAASRLRWPGGTLIGGLSAVALDETDSGVSLAGRAVMSLAACSLAFPRAGLRVPLAGGLSGMLTGDLATFRLVCRAVRRTAVVCARGSVLLGRASETRAVHSARAVLTRGRAGRQAFRLIGAAHSLAGLLTPAKPDEHSRYAQDGDCCDSTVHVCPPKAPAPRAHLIGNRPVNSGGHAPHPCQCRVS
jgi:hypothetical protein